MLYENPGVVPLVGDRPHSSCAAPRRAGAAAGAAGPGPLQAAVRRGGPEPRVLQDAPGVARGGAQAAAGAACPPLHDHLLQTDDLSSWVKKQELGVRPNLQRLPNPLLLPGRRC